MTDTTITFTDHLVPALEAGDYEITVRQEVGRGGTALETFAKTARFTVAGERFLLAPPVIQEMFPPGGSVGDHSNVLPHITLTRPTLPWEREPLKDAAVRSPWLALLLFADDDPVKTQVLPLGEIAKGPAYFPEVVLDRHESSTGSVTVIDVPAKLLRTLLPSYADLRYLTHVRGGEGSEAAVITAGRLPAPGGSSSVHLVSLEHRFHDTPGGPDFDYGAHDEIRLVSLANWRFACVDERQTLPAMTRALAHDAATFRLPDSGEPLADGFLRQGFVPARHRLRDGGRSVAWYRGPLVPGAVEGEPVSPARSADGLLRFHPRTGMFDVGHAAAWQLGRLLMLRSGDSATALYEWKRRRAQKHKRAARERADYPLAVTEIDDSLPENVLAWLTALNRLEGVPFAYLVPDERLLPMETIRFFGLDQQWMRHLIDGAYSIGRLSRADAVLDAASPLPLSHPPVTGALIRSEVVAGYPGLLIDGYPHQKDTKAPLEVVRCDRLAPNVLLCLFNGVLSRLDLHQRPESQHFAVEAPDTDGYGKSLRATGDGTVPARSRVPLSLGPRRTLPIADLVSAMASAFDTDPADFTPGDFALQMIETAERVTFLA
ncbi:hypothetical protein [Actinomadura latina]|uniref:Uncharacterized protein n=1 Tax=Actinomadura latina TaxID=163603 RepID=A0A846Z1J9_9ACTN|nr:hypothetical protein [Actinomadura latina]NKZ04273.1 hypothetical protein [Actinomadura latina]